MRRDPGRRRADTRISHQHFGVVCGDLNKKIPSIERRKRKKNGETMDIGGGSAQEGDLRLNESVTLREMTNEAREKVMYERMERMKKHMETLTTILHELRNEQRGIQEEGMRSGGITSRHVDRRNNGSTMRCRSKNEIRLWHVTLVVPCSWRKKCVD